MASDLMDFKRELIYEIIHEVDDLLALHYEELTLNKDKIKLKPMWPRYAALEAADAFVVFTAREEGKLIGYSAFFVNRHLHYEDTVLASNDVLFLHPDHRLGMTGIRLIKFSEKELSTVGAHKVTWHAKHNTHLIPILTRLGYKNEEVVMGKIL